ncbi:apoptosis-stimulating of p53 protein 1-like [Lytechinus variegatus]|uniref:apoptosis-stimulating of p53 protein 1-like n=1 Tax=Lytechinus variegatus TaxID=7654 RepID=UPI001BB15FB4|nr:apoptosis-stimulating of p53 protein 1-like [Lytechinus variegatus]
MDHNGLPGQMILKVYLSNSPDTLSDVPITPETRCRDVVEFCREAGEVQCHLAELWRGCERPIDDEEKIYDILQQWGIHRNEVKFFLRHEGANSDEQGRRSKKKTTLRDGSSSEDLKLWPIFPASKTSHQIPHAPNRPVPPLFLFPASSLLPTIALYQPAQQHSSHPDLSHSSTPHQQR